MKRSVLAGIAWIAVAENAGDQANAQPNPYRTVEHWFTLPEGRTMGSSSAVLVAPSGHIWVAERCGANSCANSDLAPMLEFDPAGKLLHSFGANMFVFPHGMWIEKDGTIWLTDGQGANGKGHQVFKFTPGGKVLMTRCEAGEAGRGRPTFNHPTSGAYDPKDGHVVS